MIAEPNAVVTAAQAASCPSIDGGANRKLAWVPAFAGMTIGVGSCARSFVFVGLTVCTNEGAR